MKIRLAEHARNHTLLRKRPNHTRTHIQAGIRSGQHRRQHHEIHHIAGKRHADRLEHEHKRTRVDTRLMPRNQRGHHRNRTDEENRKTQHRGMHGFRNRLRRILRLPRRNTNDLSARKREHHRQQRRENRDHTIREPAVIIEILKQRSMIVTGNRNRTKHGEQADHNERDNREHLDGRKPEFRLAIQSHRQNIEHEHHCNERGGPNPRGQIRKPTLHQQTSGREFRSERHRPIQPIQHGDGERGAGADETLRIQVETAGIRHSHRQFAEAEHHKIHKYGSDAIRDDRAKRAGLVNRVAGAEKQASTDHATQRNHGQMAGFHLTFKTALLDFSGFSGVSACSRCVDLRFGHARLLLHIWLGAFLRLHAFAQYPNALLYGNRWKHVACCSLLRQS